MNYQTIKLLYISNPSRAFIAWLPSAKFLDYKDEIGFVSVLKRAIPKVP